MNLIVPGEGGAPAFTPPDPGLTLAESAPWKRMDALEKAARAGFGHLELGAAPGELGDPGRLMGLALTGLRRHLHGHELAVDALRGDMVLGEAGRSHRQGARDAVRALVNLAEALGCPRIVARAAADGPPTEAARYALDVLHDVATDLDRAGVRLAIEIGGDAQAFLADADARRVLWTDAPDRVDAALTDADLATGAVPAEGLGGLDAHAGLARLGADEDRHGQLTLRRRTEAEALLRGLLRGGFGGVLSVLPTAEHGDATGLRALHDRLTQTVAAACT